MEIAGIETSYAERKQHKERELLGGFHLSLPKLRALFLCLLCDLGTLKMQHNIRLVVIGSGGVGKSALTIQYVRNVFYKHPPGEDSYSYLTKVDGKNVTLEILETGIDQFSFEMREQYIRSCDGFILVYSAVADSTFTDIAEFGDQIMRVKEGDLPVVLVGNKADLDSQRKVPRAQGEELANSFGCGFFEASAKTRLNVEEIFQSLLRLVFATRGTRKRKKNCVLF